MEDAGVLAGAFDRAAELGEQVLHVADVGEVGHIVESDGLLGEQGGRHEREGGVL